MNWSGRLASVMSPVKQVSERRTFYHPTIAADRIGDDPIFGEPICYAFSLPCPCVCSPYRRWLPIPRRSIQLQTGRGRDAGYPAPPAQIPASGTTAQGSYLR